MGEGVAASEPPSPPEVARTQPRWLQWPESAVTECGDHCPESGEARSGVSHIEGLPGQGLPDAAMTCRQIGLGGGASRGPALSGRTLRTSLPARHRTRTSQAQRERGQHTFAGQPHPDRGGDSPAPAAAPAASNRRQAGQRRMTAGTRPPRRRRPHRLARCAHVGSERHRTTRRPDAFRPISPPEPELPAGFSRGGTSSGALPSPIWRLYAVHLYTTDRRPEETWKTWTPR